MIPDKIKKLLKSGNVIFLATSSKNAVPNLVAVESCGLSGEKILIADCHMAKTSANLKENDKVSLLVTDKKDYYQIKGICEYKAEGKEFEEVSKMLEGTGYTAKCVLIICCNEIYDLQNYTKVL